MTPSCSRREHIYSTAPWFPTKQQTPCLPYVRNFPYNYKDKGKYSFLIPNLMSTKNTCNTLTPLWGRLKAKACSWRRIVFTEWNLLSSSFEINIVLVITSSTPEHGKIFNNNSKSEKAAWCIVIFVPFVRKILSEGFSSFFIYIALELRTHWFFNLWNIFSYAEARGIHWFAGLHETLIGERKFLADN